MIQPFDTLPQHSSVWIYQSDRFFSEAESAEINQSVQAFIGSWTKHGEPVLAAYTIPYNRFIIVAVDQQKTPLSGCGIDKKVKLIKTIEERYNVTLLDRMQVAYKINDTIETLHLSAFQEKIKSNEITGDTIIFNNLVQTIEAYNNKWTIPVKDSWYAKYLD